MTIANRMLPLGFGGGLGFSNANAATAGPSDMLLALVSLLALLTLLYAAFVFRPRTKGGKFGPPIVTTSPVCGIPVIGTIIEFGKSPVKMVQRCYEDYGPVFTVPVSWVVYVVVVPMTIMIAALQHCLLLLLLLLLVFFNGIIIIIIISLSLTSPLLSCTNDNNSFLVNLHIIIDIAAANNIVHTFQFFFVCSSSTNVSPSSSAPKPRSHSSRHPMKSSPKMKSTDS